MRLQPSLVIAPVLLLLAACGQQDPLGDVFTAGGGGATRLSPSAGVSISADVRPLVGVDDQGNAWALWRDEVPGTEGQPRRAGRLLAARFDAARGWAAPETVGISEVFRVESRAISLAVNRQGQALVVTGPGLTFPPHAVLLTPALGWSEPIPLRSGSPRLPAAGLADDGTPTALWYGYLPALEAYEIWAGTITRDRGWETAQRVSAFQPVPDQAFVLALDGLGGAMAAWRSTGLERLDGITPVQFAQLVPGRNWYAGVLTSGLPPGLHIGLSATADRHGNAWVAWDMPEGVSVADLSAKRTRTVPVRLAAPGALAPRVHHDGQGGAIVTWESPRGLEASDSMPGRGWSQPRAQDTVPADPRPYPVAAHDSGVDEAGRVTVAWATREGQILAASFTAAGGWSQAVRLQATRRPARHPRVAVNGSGDAFVVWAENEGARDAIWAARLVP